MARRSTAVLATAALVVLAVMALFAGELSNTQVKSKQDVEARVHERGVLAGALIDALVQSTLTQVHQYETTFGGRTVSRAALDQARGQSGFEAVLDATGRRVLASSAGFTPQARRDLASSAALALVRAGRPYGVGNVLPYGRTGVVDLAVPFPTRYGTRILLTGISPLALGGLLTGELARIPGVKGAHNYLLDAHLTVIASTNPARPSGYRFTDPASVAALSRTTGDRNGHYYDETRLTNSTWRVVLTAPNGPLFASVSGLHKWIPWIILAAFALMAAAALLLGARILRSAEGRLTATEREAVTERHQLEQQITQMRKLESLGQLAGGVAHDFNNLLGVILNYAQFVGEDVNAAAREDADRWGPVAADVTEIEHAARRATALTRQLLAFARREAIHPEVINLNDIVAETQQLLRRTLGEHIVLQCELAGDLAPVVADPGQIGQVLINLAVNARDAMPDGGTLAIETANAAVDMSYASARPDLTPGDYVRIRVSDTGVGMDADTVEHAFEPFFTTKAEGEGTGLGLATIYGIVTQSGGRVRLYSEPGTGTTCTIMLPATTREASALARPAPDERGGRGEVILMVEDEDGIREVARRILTRCGYTVLAAASGPDALEIAAQHDGEIDLLMTDVIMPRMLGKEVALRIQATRPNVHVMFMSGYAQPVLDANANVPAGMVLLEKPFTEQGLLAKVRVALSSSAAA